MGTQVEVTHKLGVELDHYCPHCQTTAAANVIGIGHGAKQSSMWSSGESDARFQAQDAAERDAALMVRLAHCPNCSKRDGSEVRKFWIKAAIIGLLLAAIPAGIGAAIDHLEFKQIGPLTGTLGGLAFVGWLATAGARLARTRKRVRFLSRGATP